MIVGYIAILVVVNRVPNVRIKRIGFFSLFGITIESPTHVVRIHKLHLKMNLFKGKDSPLKLFNVELTNVEVTIIANPLLPMKRTEQVKHPEQVVNLQQVLNFGLSKRVYDWVFYYQILNNIHIIIFRGSIYDEKLDSDTALTFDYAKLENCLKYDGHNVMTLLIFNGFLHGIKDQERIQIFRNIELILSCDAIFNCSLESVQRMQADITNFSLAVSLGKAHLPLDHLPEGTKRSKPKEKPQHPISKARIEFLRQFWHVFDDFTLTLEDFKASLGPYESSLATFQVSLSHKRETEQNGKSVAELNLHIASLRMFEAETKCFELPSASITFECNPFGIIEGIENTHNPQTIIGDSNSLDVRLSMTFTRPTIDIYHDQLTRLRVRSFRRSLTKQNSSDDVNLTNLILSLNYVSTRLVVVDAKLVLHVPGFGVKEYHRGSALNMVVTYTAELISKRFACNNLSEMMKCQDQQHLNLYGLIKIKNLRMEFMENVFHICKFNLLTTYNVYNKTFHLKVNSKKIKVKSINSAIFQVVKELRTRKILLENKLYTEIMDDKVSPDVLYCEGDLLVSQYVELFKIIPGIIPYIKIDIYDVQLDIICKDGLPLQRFYDEASKETVDLKDYARGISVKLGHCGVGYKKDKEEIMGNLTQLQCFTLSEFSSDYIEDFDVVAMYSGPTDFSDVSSLESITLAEKETEGFQQVKKVFDIAEVVVSNTGNKQRDKNRLSVKIDEINGRADIFLVWCVVYASTLLKNFSPQIERACSKQEMKSLLGKKDSVLKLDITVNLIAIVTRLPKKVDVLCEFDALHVKDVFETKSLEFSYFRSYVVHPKTKLWARFLSVKESFVTANAEIDSERALDMVCQGVRLNIPHGFLFYTVIDNIVTFGKAIKQVTHNFRNLYDDINDFESIKPEARAPFKMIPVRLRTKLLGVTLESDPFESEISYILELGKIEQKVRLKKWAAFHKKAQEILANTVDSKIGLQDKVRSNSRTFFNLGQESANNYNTPLLSTDEAQSIINEAKETLEYEISMSWIKKFKKFRSNKIRNWHQRQERAWGKEDMDDGISDKFDILNYFPGPLLLGSFFKDLDFHVRAAQIDDLDQFLADFGKGQPKFDYSILIPLFISLKSSLMFVFLRDYALPLLSFPQSNGSAPAISIEGNVVINERLATRKQEMRYIWVPFSPPMAPELASDNFYSVLVPRTLTPVKFMCDVTCKINSERAAMISWSKSYQAAFSTAILALDNFTKPKIDDSPLGWWDKVALLAHGRITFEIANELCFHIKSGMDPYDLTGRSAGFVFCWKNNVVLRIDGNRDSTELVTLHSDDFLLAIPNYSVAEKRSWSLFYDEMVDASADMDAEIRKYNKRVMELSSDEKVRWTLGFLFERNAQPHAALSDAAQRVSEFKPHYDVIVTSPLFDDHPDSYLGFRSDYLHMAISVQSVSLSNNCANTIHLTPLTFAYFFYWWHTITEQISLPVRQGPLFSEDVADKSHVKLSAHLFTVKYQLVLDPLTISHLYMHSAGKENNRVTFTGLKSRSAKVIVDLHQRKEVLRYVNKKLQIENKILHLKMNQAEISFQETDIRLVNAEFADKSIEADVARYLVNGVSDSSSGETGTSGRYFDWGNRDVSGDDLSWIDQEDFIELEQRHLLSPYPDITVIPLCYTPRFTYVREFSFHDNGPYPFGNEATHNCQIGLERPEDTQAGLLEGRLNSIKEEIAANYNLLRTLEAQDRDELVEQELDKIQRDIAKTRQRQELLEDVYEEITGKLAPGLDDLQTQNSRASPADGQRYSVYSGHRSVDEVNRMRLLNKEASEFHNRYIVHNLQFKWNNRTRDLFVTYFGLVGDRRSEMYFMGRKAVSLVEAVVNAVPGEFDVPKLDDAFEDAFGASASAGGSGDAGGSGVGVGIGSGDGGGDAADDIINGFDAYLDDIDPHQEAEHKYLIKLVHPQIQLVSEKDVNSAALIVSKDLELRVISINLKGFSTMVNADNEVSGLIESRYGGLFNTLSIFVFRKDDTVITHPAVPYGYVGHQLAVDWPPWVECESIYDGKWLADKLVTLRNTMGLTIRKPNYLYAETSTNLNQKDEIKVHIAKFVLNADSRQYSTLFYVVTDLLVHTKTETDLLRNKLDKIMSLADTDDFYGLDRRVHELQESIREYHNILLKLDIKSIKLSPFEAHQANQLELEVARRRLELSTIMRGLGLRNMKLNINKRVAKSWLIRIDQIIWHVLDENRNPFIDLALADAKFQRVDAMDGSNRNIVDVRMIQGFNLQENAVYQELLTPLDEACKDVPVISMKWRMLDPVGGISIMQAAKLSVQPMKLQLDYNTSKKLFDYIFPRDKRQKTDKSVKTGKTDKTDKSVKTVRSPSESEHSGPYGPSPRGVSYLESDISSLESPLERPKNIFQHFKSSKKDDDADSASTYSSRKVSSMFSSTEDLSSPHTEPRTKPKRARKYNTDDAENDIALIMSRSSKFISMVDIEVEKVKLVISFKAPGHLNIIDVHNLSLNIPTLQYRNKTWTGEDFILRLRKDIIKVILQHTGQILGNKFKIRRRRMLKQPLKQIANYASLITVQDLQGDGKPEVTEAETEEYHRHHPARRLKRAKDDTFDNILQEIIDEEDFNTEDPA